VKTNSGFDFLAPVYDTMARMVFGKAMVDSQTCFLDQIPAGAEVLILGGGTGWLLEKISQQNRSCKILYVDISAEMIKKSRQRKTQDEIDFIQGTEMDIPNGKKFDVIITNFYFDLFSDKRLNQILKHLQGHTRPGSLWIVTEFMDTVWWHRALLKLMYVFFRTVCHIEGSRLPAWKPAFQAKNWRELAAQLRFNGFINTSFWVR
jgi:tRNA (cmo5U34)-methyltransferase